VKNLYYVSVGKIGNMADGVMKKSIGAKHCLRLGEIPLAEALECV
jgi:hypothetical protein